MLLDGDPESCLNWEEICEKLVASNKVGWVGRKEEYESIQFNSLTYLHALLPAPTV